MAELRRCGWIEVYKSHVDPSNLQTDEFGFLYGDKGHNTEPDSRVNDSPPIGDASTDREVVP